jgi:O-antigen/teichoic acid export membrane protein
MSSVRRNMLWMGSSQATVFVCQFVTTVLIARLLSPYEMGVFAAALAVVGLLGIVRSFGLSNYVIRAQVLTPTMLATTFTINVLLSMLIAALVAGTAILGGAILDEPGVRRVLLVVAVVPLLNVFDFLPSSVMERQGRFGVLAAVNVTRTLVGSVLSVVLAFEGHSYMSLAYGQVAGGVVSAIGMNLFTKPRASLRMGLEGWRDVLRFGTHMLAIGGTSAAAARIAELVMARLLGLGTLGLYARAGSLANAAWEAVHLVVARALFVELAEQHRQGQSLRQSYLRVVAMTTALLWPAFTGLAILAGPLVVALYGEKWTEAQLPLALLALSALPSVAMLAAGPVLTITGRTASQARIEMIRSASGLILFTGGCFLGLPWAAGARILETMLSFALYRRLVQEMTATREQDFTPIYLRGLVLTVASVGPAAAVMLYHQWNPLVPFGAVAAAVLAGAAMWAVLLQQMRHPLFDEALWLLARLGLRRPSRQAP